jgi:hypothetical protein
MGGVANGLLAIGQKSAWSSHCDPTPPRWYVRNRAQQRTLEDDSFAARSSSSAQPECRRALLDARRLVMLIPWRFDWVA